MSPPTPVVEMIPDGVARPAFAGHGVDLAPDAAAADAHGAGLVVGDDVLQAGQVDDHPVVDDAEAAAVVPAAADRDQRAAGAGERDRARDVVGARAAHDDRRPAVDHPVVDGARLVVARIGGSDDAVAVAVELAVRGVGEGNGGAHSTLLR